MAGPQKDSSADERGGVELFFHSSVEGPRARGRTRLAMPGLRRANRSGRHNSTPGALMQPDDTDDDGAVAGLSAPSAVARLLDECAGASDSWLRLGLKCSERSGTPLMRDREPTPTALSAALDGVYYALTFDEDGSRKVMLRPKHEARSSRFDLARVGRPGTARPRAPVARTQWSGEGPCGASEAPPLALPSKGRPATRSCTRGDR